MSLDNLRLPSFLQQQLQECGGKVEIEPGGLWLLFAVESSDAESNALAQALLADVPFAHDSGTSQDDQWTLYYVDDANRAAAMHWLEDLQKRVAGEVRPVAPEHRGIIAQLATSPMPHRVALQLAKLHDRGELPPGCIADHAFIRKLIDRWHLSGALFLPAFRTLLAHHLVDLVALLDELIQDDLDILNVVVKLESSREPAEINRREACTEIRRMLIRFHVISSLDHQSNDAIGNPYAAFVDISSVGDRVLAPVDGVMVRVLREHFLAAIWATRRRLYAGADWESFTTLDSWVTQDIALPFRFLKQRHAVRRDLAPMDWLYFVERAI